MRPTYRTMCVLAAIADQPGASNREVAAAAGIRDEGQASRLLKRLAGLGLIENTGPGHLSGGPNAWVLTARGVEVLRAIGEQDDG